MFLHKKINDRYFYESMSSFCLLREQDTFGRLFFSIPAKGDNIPAKGDNFCDFLFCFVFFFTACQSPSERDLLFKEKNLLPDSFLID